MNVSIRRAEPQEAQTISNIALAAKRHWGYPERWIELWTPQLTFDANYFESHESWTAVVEGEPIGFYTLLDRDGIAWIDNLFVTPDWIGNGIGRRLFHHAMEAARERGYKTLQLEADPNAVGFYQRMGMHTVGERRSEVDGQPRLLPIMERSL